MQYILLTIVVFMVAAQNIAEKQYNVKVQNGNAFLLAGLSSLVAMAFSCFVPDSDSALSGE